MDINDNRPVLVIGGTGHYGQHVVKSLLEKNVKVRVLSRDAAKARKIVGETPEIVEGDITSRESVIEAINGVSAIVIGVSAFTPKLIRRMKAIEMDSVLMVLDEAAAAGISRVVYISVYDIKQDLQQDLPKGVNLESLQRSAKIKSEVENALAKSNFNWTVLGAAPSMQIFFSMIHGDTMTVPGGGPPAFPTVSAADVGEIVAQAVLRKDLHGKRFRMVGPEALSFPEAAKRISSATGKTIKFRKIPLVAPKIAWRITRPLTPFSDAILFINQILSMIQLLNHFPQDVAAGVPEIHRLLRETFDYLPTTIEMEVQRRSIKAIGEKES